MNVCEKFVDEFLNYTFNSSLNQYVELIVFLGSAVEGRWIKGFSDIDVIIFLNRSGVVENKIYELYLSLNRELDTGVMDAPLFHPPLLFVRSPFEYMILTKILGKRGERVRKVVKRMAYVIVPRNKCLIKVFIKAPKCFNTLALIALLMLESIFDVLASIFHVKSMDVKMLLIGNSNSKGTSRYR